MNRAVLFHVALNVELNGLEDEVAGDSTACMHAEEVGEDECMGRTVEGVEGGDSARRINEGNEEAKEYRTGCVGVIGDAAEAPAGGKDGTEGTDGTQVKAAGAEVKAAATSRFRYTAGS